MRTTMLDLEVVIHRYFFKSQTKRNVYFYFEIHSSLRRDNIHQSLSQDEPFCLIGFQ